MFLPRKLVQILSRIFSFKTKPTIGLSIDPNVNLKDMPASPLIRVGKFVQFNKEMVHFEVVFVNTINRTVRIAEICTDNEYTMDFELFECLFSETPTPKECVL
jgi:hypothetical protein